MAKRGRGDQLTGGTGDVNPQEFVFPVLDTANGSALAWNPTAGITSTGFVVQTSIPTPISRLPQRDNKVTVIEALYAEFYITNLELPAGAQVAVRYMNITTNPILPNSITAAGMGARDPRTVADWNKLTYWASAVGFTDIEAYHEVDLTDQAGHGILVATDTLYANFVATGITTALNGLDVGVARLGYRFKDVSLAEYIGIVQSQS